MFHKTTFKNGLRLLTIPLKNTNTVTVLIMVKTGSKYETKEKRGISHFLEHMIFKGTKKRKSARDIANELDSVGSMYNAFTGKEYTGYFVKVSRQHLDLAMDIISDIFLRSTFPAKEIEKEKGVIIEEINMYEDIPMRKIHDVFEELLYGDTPAGWSIAGDKQIISQMQRSDFIDYLEKHYFTKNTVVVVAGSIDDKAIVEEVSKRFAELKEGMGQKKEKTREYQEKPNMVLSFKKTDQAHFSLGFRAFDQYDERRFALSILAVVLGGNMSSRLFTEVREKRGLAYYVSSDSQLYSDSGYFTSNAGVRLDSLKPALKVIMKEYESLRNKLIGAKELKKAKEFAIGRMILGLESSDEWASFYAPQELWEKRVMKPEEIIEKIKEVEASQIKRIAEDIFKPQGLNLAIIGPYEEKKEFEELLGKV